MAGEALRSILETVALTDVEIRTATRHAAAEARKSIMALEGKEGVGAAVRRAQLQVAEHQTAMWRNVLDATKVGIGDATDAAAELGSFYDEAFMRKVGVNSQYWRASQMATARQGIESFIARKVNGISLSDRVYRNTALSNGMVDKAINNGLLLGKSARELAADVERFIDPAVPGGSSSAAMRLARTEINNAHHTVSRNKYQTTPWVEGIEWSLSGSHSKPDLCDEYAGEVHFRGGEPGVFKPTECPDKPHPHCFCYITPVQVGEEEFIKNFQQGKYDHYVEEESGCGRVA